MLGLGTGLSTGGGVSGLIPTDISGLDLWLKFNTGIAGASNTTAAGNMSDDEVIHSWADQAENHNAEQTTDAHRPNWEDATTDISFNGDNDHFDLGQHASDDLEIPVNTDFTIMIRHKFPNFDAAGALIGHVANDVIRVNSNAVIVVKISDSTANSWEEEGSLDFQEDVYYIFTLVRSGGSDGALKMYVHGTGNDDNSTHSDRSWDDAEDHGDADAFTLSNIGASADTALNPIGFMRDVIVWNGTALNASQRADMYSYINAQT